MSKVHRHLAFPAFLAFVAACLLYVLQMLTKAVHADVGIAIGEQVCVVGARQADADWRSLFLRRESGIMY